MKFQPHIKPGSRWGRIPGFTLVETMITMWIFIIIFVGALVGLQIFGLRVYTLGGTKLSASGAALKVLNQIRDDVRGAKSVDVGNLATAGDPSTFQLTGDTNKNAGAALRVCSLNPGVAPYSIYFMDTRGTTNCLKMAITTNGTDFNPPVLLANYVTNRIVFTAEDCMKNALTNDSFNRIIRMELDFYQWEYPVGYVGGVAANAYSSYTVMTRITCRQID